MSCANRQISTAQSERSRDVLAENTILSLIKAHNYIQEQHLQLFKRFGITPQQYNVLRILYVRGEQGLCNSEIANLMITRVPDMTRLIDRMERDQLLKRVRSENDRRMVSIFLLERGRELCEAVDNPLLETVERLMSKLSPAEQEQLLALLERVYR